MIRTARAYFLSRLLREKLLLVAFIAIGVLWWLSAFGTRLGTFWRDQRLTTSRLTEQAEWIKNKVVIEETAKKTASRLDPAKTLNGNQLVTTVSQLATEAGVKNAQTSGSTVTTPAGQFAVHSQEYVIRNIEWESTLTAFYTALQKRSPYISIERFILAASAPDSPQLTLSLKVTSVEITR
ncbi:hypothetical protein [Horticoccus sp. 23ND18S-11]|uniref:hypothetical protein n=1 Tax=Horticoccus sp. 23ND18S-11 TaxID=3391832 RepID=UPI0039C8D0D5